MLKVGAHPGWPLDVRILYLTTLRQGGMFQARTRTGSAAAGTSSVAIIINHPAAVRRQRAIAAAWREPSLPSPIRSDAGRRADPRDGAASSAERAGDRR